MSKPFVIGVTGTIASGKSAVGNTLATLGVPVIDTDKIVHALLTEDSAARRAVIERFGTEISDPTKNGAVDRAKLGKIVFADDSARKDLELILHPAVRAECTNQIARLAEEQRSSIVAVLVPLLFEAGLQKNYDQIWCVYTDEKVLRQRLQQRDNLSAEMIEKRISTQMSQDKKRAMSDVVIDNSGTLQQTEGQVKLELERLNNAFKISH